MPLSKKAAILFAFALRLPVIVPAALRIHYLSDALNSPDFTLDVTYEIICKQSEISYAIIGATLPCLRPFMTATATNYGAPAEGHKTKQGSNGGIYGRSGSSDKASRGNPNHGHVGLSLTSLTSKLGQRGHPEKHNGFPPMSGDYNGPTYGIDSYGQHTATVVASHPSRDAHSIDSSESKQMIIRKDVEYAVEYDSGPADREADNKGNGRVL
jgi:hypothetical protein